MIPTTGLWTTTQQQQRKRKRKPKNASVLLFTLCIERTSCSQLSLKMFLWFHNFRIFVPFWKLTLVVVNTIIRLDDEANAIFIFDYIYMKSTWLRSRRYPARFSRDLTLVSETVPLKSKIKLLYIYRSYLTYISYKMMKRLFHQLPYLGSSFHTSSMCEFTEFRPVA